MQGMIWQMEGGKLIRGRKWQTIRALCPNADIIGPTKVRSENERMELILSKYPSVVMVLTVGEM